MNPDQATALQIHQQARAELSVAPLTWAAALAADAQQYAQHLASQNQGLQHSQHLGPLNQGENLANSHGPWQNPYTESSKLWYAEKRDWVQGSVVQGPGAGPVVGHYTQMIWSTTTHVGMGCAISPSGATYVVARYSPRGNYVGQRPEGAAVPGQALVPSGGALPGQALIPQQQQQQQQKKKKKPKAHNNAQQQPPGNKYDQFEYHGQQMPGANGNYYDPWQQSFQYPGQNVLYPPSTPNPFGSSMQVGPGGSWSPGSSPPSSPFGNPYSMGPFGPYIPPTGRRRGHGQSTVGCTVM